MVVLIATVAIGLYLLLSVLLGGWPASSWPSSSFMGWALASAPTCWISAMPSCALRVARILNRLNDAFESAINATLALLGGAG